jgi:hypothetical protein
MCIFIHYEFSSVALLLNHLNKSHIAHKKTKLKGAVVGLLRGVESEIQDVKERNKSLMKYLFSNSFNSSSPQRWDVIFFHESRLSESYVNQITSNSTELHVSFIEIQFDGHAIMDENNKPKLIRPICPPNGMTEFMGFGYKNMCRFWFIGFMDYLLEYDWILRLDPDCKLIEPSFGVFDDDNIAGRLQKLIIASPVWIPLHLQLNYFARVSTAYTGGLCCTVY